MANDVVVRNPATRGVRVATPSDDTDLIVLPVPGIPGTSGDQEALDAIAAHIIDPTPHPAYDEDMPDLATIVHNGLV